MIAKVRRLFVQGEVLFHNPRPGGDRQHGRIDADDMIRVTDRDGPHPSQRRNRREVRIAFRRGVTADAMQDCRIVRRQAPIDARVTEPIECAANLDERTGA